MPAEAQEAAATEQAQTNVANAQAAVDAAARTPAPGAPAAGAPAAGAPPPPAPAEEEDLGESGPGDLGEGDIQASQESIGEATVEFHKLIDASGGSESIAERSRMFKDFMENAQLEQRAIVRENAGLEDDDAVEH